MGPPRRMAPASSCKTPCMQGFMLGAEPAHGTLPGRASPAMSSLPRKTSARSASSHRSQDRVDSCASPTPRTRRLARAQLHGESGASASSSSAASPSSTARGGIGLERATFAVRRQELVFLVGPTGSGKSTIMRLLIKELEPTDGRIRVAGSRSLGDRAQEGPLLPAQHRRRLPGLQAPAHANRVRQRRLRAAGDRRQSRKQIRETPARHPAPHRPVHEAAQLPRTSCPAASSSASPWRARSQAILRCCWPTSRPATSTPRPRSGSCSCCTASTAPARRCSSPRTTTRWSTACAAA